MGKQNPYDKKTAMLVYASWRTMIKAMPKEDAGELIQAVCHFCDGEEYEITNPTLIGVVQMICDKVELDQITYAENAKQRSDWARDAANARWHKNDAEGMQGHASACGTMRNDANYNYISNYNSISNDTYISTSPNGEDNNPPVLPNGNTVPPSGGGRKKPAPKAVYSPDPALDDAIHEFVKHRKAMRKPMTDKAIELFINKLNKLAPGDNDKQIRLINTAIEHGWQSVYEEKQQSNVVGMTAGQRLNKEQNDVLKAVYQGLI